MGLQATGRGILWYIQGEDCTDGSMGPFQAVVITAGNDLAEIDKAISDALGPRHTMYRLDTLQRVGEVPRPDLPLYQNLDR